MKKVFLVLVGQLLTISMAFAMNPEDLSEGMDWSPTTTTVNPRPMEVEILPEEDIAYIVAMQGPGSEELIDTCLKVLADWPNVAIILQRKCVSFLSFMEKVFHSVENITLRAPLIAENHFKFFEGLWEGQDIFLLSLLDLDERRLRALSEGMHAKTLSHNYKMNCFRRQKALRLFWLCSPSQIENLAHYMVPWVEDVADGPKGEVRFCEVMWILIRDVLSHSSRFKRLSRTGDLQRMSFFDVTHHMERQRAMFWDPAA